MCKHFPPVVKTRKILNENNHKKINIHYIFLPVNKTVPQDV